MTDPTSSRPDSFDQLRTAVGELGRLRRALAQVVELGGAAPDLTDRELRDRLLRLACEAMTLQRRGDDNTPD